MALDIEIELTEAEHKAVENAAEACGLTASEYVRLTILAAIGAASSRETPRQVANTTRIRL